MKKFKNKSVLKQDILVLLFIPILASIISLAFNTSFLTSTILFFGVPSLYLSLRNPNIFLKSFLVSLIGGISFGILADYLGTLNGAWLVLDSSFSFRVLGIIPVEDLVWAWLLVFNVILFYEHFQDKGKQKLKDTKWKHFILALIVLFVLFFLGYFLKPEIFFVDYFYLKAGIVGILIPLVTFFSKFPKMVSKFLKVGSYFFAQGIIFELTGLYLNHWTFRGDNFIGWVSLGSLSFPLEEFVFWMVLLAVCILSYYEFFFDDRK